MTKLKGLSSFIEGPEVSHKFKTRLTKETIGLDQVDNTSDKDKPVSDAAQKALQEEAYQRIQEDNYLREIIDLKSRLQSADSSIKVTAGKWEDAKWVPTDISVNIDKDTLIQNSEGTLSTGLTINYDATTRYIQLLSSSGLKLSDIDATPFLRDGILYGTTVFMATSSSMDITIKAQTHTFLNLVDNNHYLAFLFKVSDGSNEEFSWDILDITSVIDVFEAGTGLVLNNHTFNIQAASTTEKYLKINADSISIEGVDNAIQIESDRAINQEDIIESAVGLTVDGTHITTSGNYTSKATTIAGEISALDAQVKLNADAIGVLNSEGEGSVKNALKDAKDYTDTKIENLDVEAAGGTGKVVTTISETDGIISATAIDLTSAIVNRQATESSSTKVAVTGTNVEEAIESLATSIKTVKDNAAKYSIKKVTDNLSSNVKEAYQLVETVEGISTDVGSQIPIYKDSSLKSVELTNVNDKKTKGQFLKFTYITDEGTDNIVYLDVSTFLVEAEFKDGLQVNSSGEVSIKIADDSEFLSVDENGLKVSGIENIPTVTDKVTVSKEITVEGGPLADLYKKALGKNTIDADITMQKLLEILFTKELWPTNITFTEGTISASIAAPNFSVNSTLVEVGSTVTVNACTPTSTSYSTSARKLSGLTYGYSTDKVTKNTNTSISVAATNTALNGNYTVTRTILGSPETKTGSISEVALTSTTFTASEGSNTVKVAITGASASCSFAALNSVWYYSNLDNMEDTHKTSAYTTVTKSTSTPSNSKSITVTGVYPVYATKSSISSLDKLSLQTSTTYEISMPAETSTGKQSFAIYSGKSIKSIQRFDTVANTYQSYSLSDFTTSTVSYTIGTNNTVTYTKYIRNAGTNGATKFKIILS